MAEHKETVIEVTHYTDTLFHIKTTRGSGVRFRDGEFMMIGLDHWSEKLQKNKPIVRAYSVASPNHADYLEFYSIKVQDGPLTSRLQHIKVGDEIIVKGKPTGTLVMPFIKPGRNLYFIATGTGIAPFMGLLRGLETYDDYDNVIVVWGARIEKELPFVDFINGLNEDEIYSEVTQGKIKTYFTCTREDYKNTGRVTTAMYSGDVQSKLGLDKLDPEHDRVMICGGIEMNLELQEYLEEQGFTEGNNKTPGEYVVERAFVG
jgi:ferredoxin--NADP+ reductase|tara:strand:- start:120 stop:902 length:783 start_codon:yes stop_codon:yes gene_type:complete